MPHPSSTSAYGIWSLNEVRDAERGDNWPERQAILLTYTMSQSSLLGGMTAASYANMTNDNYLETTATGTAYETNAFVRCDLGSVKTITSINIAPAHSGLTGGWDASYTSGSDVRYSNDAATWTTAFTTPTMTAGVLDETAVNIQARYVEINAGASIDYLALCEFQLIGYP